MLTMSNSVPPSTALLIAAGQHEHEPGVRGEMVTSSASLPAQPPWRPPLPPWAKGGEPDVEPAEPVAESEQLQPLAPLAVPSPTWEASADVVDAGAVPNDVAPKSSPAPGKRRRRRRRKPTSLTEATVSATPNLDQVRRWRSEDGRS
jgi:hypothetical protein